jgi:hypothetical protein
LARYARFLLGYGTYDGVTILSSNAVAALWSDQSDEVALVHKEGYAKSGLGWDQMRIPPLPMPDKWRGKTATA